MSRSISVSQADAVAVRFGCTVFEQRGFYSHFIRVRRELETLDCIHIRRGHISLRALMRTLEKVGPIEHPTVLEYHRRGQP